MSHERRRGDDGGAGPTTQTGRSLAGTQTGATRPTTTRRPGPRAPPRSARAAATSLRKVTCRPRRTRRRASSPAASRAAAPSSTPRAAAVAPARGQMWPHHRRDVVSTPVLAASAAAPSRPAGRAAGSHRRHCDGGTWRCGWCGASSKDSGHRKNPGPKGPATLCGPCGGRYRQGATGPPKRDAEGNFLCDSCDAKFPTNFGAVRPPALL